MPDPAGNERHSGWRGDRPHAKLPRRLVPPQAPAARESEEVVGDEETRGAGRNRVRAGGNLEPEAVRRGRAGAAGVESRIDEGVRRCRFHSQFDKLVSMASAQPRFSRHARLKSMKNWTVSKSSCNAIQSPPEASFADQQDRSRKLDPSRMCYENSMMLLLFTRRAGKMKYFQYDRCWGHARASQPIGIAIVRHMRDAGHLAQERTEGQSEGFAAADGMLAGELRCRRRVASEPSLIRRKWSLEAYQARTAEGACGCGRGRQPMASARGNSVRRAPARRQSGDR